MHAGFWRNMGAAVAASGRPRESLTESARAIHKGREVGAGPEWRFLRNALGLGNMLLCLFFALCTTEVSHLILMFIPAFVY
mgnify:CR=1 FL=1